MKLLTLDDEEPNIEDLGRKRRFRDISDVNIATLEGRLKRYPKNVFKRDW